MIRASLTILISIFILSCNRLKDKEKQLKEVPQKIKNKADDVLDKAFPEFNPYDPDTKANKKRFSDFLKVELMPDIKNIYCYDDAIGIDATYQFSFNCDDSTAERIIVAHKLKEDTSSINSGLGLTTEFNWWKKEKISKLKLYSWNQGQYYKNFWYDPIEKKAYYLDYDM